MTRTTRAVTDADRAKEAWIEIHGTPFQTNARLGRRFHALLTEDSTFEPPTDAMHGQPVEWCFEQDTVGGHALTAVGFTVSGTVVVNTAAGGKTFLRAVYSKDSRSFDLVAVPDLSSIYATTAYVTAAIATAVAAMQLPIGSVFIAVVGTDPATLLGYGTWSAIGTGKVLVGIDDGDPDFDALEETGGSKTVAANGVNTGGAVADHPATATSAESAQANMDPGAVAVAASPHTHNTPILSHAVTDPTFTGTPTSVVQPYLVVAIWKRTA